MLLTAGTYGSSLELLATLPGQSHIDDRSSLVVAALGVLIAAVGVLLSHLKSREAGRQSSQANEIAEKARKDAAGNAERLRALSVRLERLGAFEDRLHRLRQHRKGFRDSLAAIEGVDGDSGNQNEDVVQRSRMLSRSFRSAMEHYGESFDIFQALRNDLTPTTVRELEEGMSQASSLFTANFSAPQVRAVASAHGRVLDTVSEAAEAALVDLKERIDTVVGGESELAGPVR
jgi:hypothetical protein